MAAAAAYQHHEEVVVIREAKHVQEQIIYNAAPEREENKNKYPKHDIVPEI